MASYSAERDYSRDHCSNPDPSTVQHPGTNAQRIYRPYKYLPIEGTAPALQTRERSISATASESSEAKEVKRALFAGGHPPPSRQRSRDSYEVSESRRRRAIANQSDGDDTSNVAQTSKASRTVSDSEGNAHDEAEGSRESPSLSDPQRTYGRVEAQGSKALSHLEDDDSEEDDQDDAEWNIFTQTKMPTVLRPRPATRFSRTAQYEDGSFMEQPSRRQSRRQARPRTTASRVTLSPIASTTNPSKPNKRRLDARVPGNDVSKIPFTPLPKRQAAQANFPTRGNTQTPSADPIQATPRTKPKGRPPYKKQQPAPATNLTPSSSIQTRTPSTAPVRAQQSNVINMDSDPGEEDTQERAMKVEDMGEQIPAATGGEHLSSQALTKTILFVSASNQPGKAPVSVSLSLCRSANRVFDTLIAECGLKPEAAQKVADISATYPWSHRGHRIRRNRPEDWARLLTTIQNAWNSQGGSFEADEDGECKVDLMIHVDE